MQPDDRVGSQQVNLSMDPHPCSDPRAGLSFSMTFSKEAMRQTVRLDNGLVLTNKSVCRIISSGVTVDKCGGWLLHF